MGLRGEMYDWLCTETYRYRIRAVGPLSKRVDATMTSFLEPSAAPQIRKSDQPGTSIKDGCNLFTGSQSLHSTPPSSSLSPPTSYLSHFIFTTPLHSHERPVSVSVQLIVIKCWGNLEGRLFDFMDIVHISSWIDNKIQGDEHVVIVKFCLGRFNHKSFTFPFSEYLYVGQKVGNSYYSTTRSSSKSFRVGYE